MSPSVVLRAEQRGRRSVTAMAMATTPTAPGPDAELTKEDQASLPPATLPASSQWAALGTDVAYEHMEPIILADDREEPHR
jgi:hypothetical protein